MDAIFTPARIQDRAVELPAGLPDGAFVREMEISSTRLDSYFTHMMASTLQNFAQEAKEGRSFLDSHDGGKLGLGYTFGGELAIEGDNALAVANFYTVPGIRFGGQHSFASTDDFIKAVEARIVRDVSVGFHGGRWVCDICGGDYFRYSQCSHFAGVEYEQTGEDGVTKRTLATVGIHDAHLSEVSAVFDGATPGAMIRKGAPRSSMVRTCSTMCWILTPTTWPSWSSGIASPCSPPLTIGGAWISPKISPANRPVEINQRPAVAIV